MRFKNQRYNSSLPVIDLIPMLNVMMSVLAFFVLISTTLGSLQVVDVQLPRDEDGQVQQANPPEPLIVRLNRQGQQVQIVVGEQPIGKEQLFQEMRGYLGQNPKGAVLLTANPDVGYEQVVQLLAEMRDVGGDRVSLGIESN
ncbi:biopolymer transporter ExbD [Coleofasciculus sp. LEGE 07092]|nr:biopolymer transporter ExbD [Coleofasciculus sp. LEGE 07081]MBE9148857.1 biopolymer transporter ExbD [Coleofasciculus sp. LEGE 07092]